MLKVKDLKKLFKSGDHVVHAVDGINIEIPTGKFASVVGKSGSGKTTLLCLLGALDKPSQGSIEVDGDDIAKMHDAKLIKYRREKIGFVFQHYNLIPNLTALENVMLPMEFSGVSKSERKKRATELLQEVGLDANKQLRKPTRLSGGEQQRVSIARALANHPKLILADEPTGNLDSATGKLIVKLLHNLAKTKNTTIIVVTHDLALAEEADMTFKLEDGKLVHSKNNLMSTSL